MKKMDFANKILIILSVIVVVAIAFAVYPHIGKNKDFSYSHGMDKNGFWKGVKALDHVNLPEYKEISIPKDVHEISEEDIEAEINAILSMHSTENQIKDRAVVDGDTVNIDYTGKIDGVEFEGGSTNGNGTDVTIGVTSYIDDFLEQLIGHTPGETFDVEVTFPEDYHADDLKGKDAVFTVTINYIVETVTPELTDEFVAENLASNYGWNNIKEMREEIENTLQEVAIRQYVQEYITENSTVTSLPKVLMKYQEDSMIASYKQYAEYYNMDLEEFLSLSEGVSSTDELLNAYVEQNTEMANYNLIIQAIAEDSNISVTEDDLAAYFSENFGTEDFSQYEELFGIPYLKFTVLQQSVLDNLIDNAVLE